MEQRLKKKMNRSFLLLVVVVGVVFGKSYFPPIWDESCSYTRMDVLNCLTTNVDVNPKNGEISKSEISEAFDRYLPWYLKPLKLVTDADEVIKSCDNNTDGVITAQDFITYNETCLPFKRNWCTVQWFCE